MSESMGPTNVIGSGAVASHDAFPLGDPRKEKVLKRLMQMIRKKESGEK